jgi:hypothetical protein
MLRRRRFFRAGAATWIAIAVGHTLLVDVLTLHGRTRAPTFSPESDFLSKMDHEVVSWGFLGSNNVFRVVAGFSLWLALSLALLGLTFLQLSRQEGVRLQPFIRIGSMTSALFFGLSLACFIWPPMLASGTATALFLASWLRHEV